MHFSGINPFWGIGFGSTEMGRNELLTPWRQIRFSDVGTGGLSIRDIGIEFGFSPMHQRGVVYYGRHGLPTRLMTAGADSCAFFGE